MSTKRLTNALFDNWIQKAICIAAAILIYVFHQVAVLEKKTFTVPLEVVSDSLFVNNSSVPSYVKITVRCSSDSIGTITPQGVKASLNLNGFTEGGSYEVPVLLSLSESLMLVDPLEVQVKPEFINVNLDEKIEKYVPVIPALSGEVSHGYVIKSIDVVPSTVKITGPKSIVEKTNYIYSGKVNVKGAATGFSAKVGLDNINKLVKTHEEEPFRVTVSITPAPSEQTFKAVVPHLINLDEKFLCTSSIPALNFTLAGTVPVMESFKLRDDDVVLDLSAITEPGRYEIPVVLNLPAGISLKGRSFDSVTLEISKNPMYKGDEEAVNNTDGSEGEGSENPSPSGETSSSAGDKPTSSDASLSGKAKTSSESKAPSKTEGGSV